MCNYSFSYSFKKNLNKTNVDITAVDLPGAYSMSPFTSEESITSDFVNNEDPDVIINIVDATNLIRSLFFTTQLLELDIPVVVALNKSDLTKKKKTDVDVNGLSKILGCPVVETVSTKSGNNGLEKLISTAVAVKGNTQSAPFYALDVNFKDKKSVEASDIKRYEFVKAMVSNIEKRKVDSGSQTKQDAMDRIIAHKWLGIPNFAAVMWMVFSLTQTHLGPLLADTFVAGIDNFYAWVGTSMYFAGIAIIIGGALLVVRITGEKNERSYFIMELPVYKITSIKRATISMLSRGKAFVIKAGTIILLSNAVVQMMQTFNWQFEVVGEGAADTSILASIASPFAVLLIPLGFGAWQLAAAAITGFIAKENVVGTLAVVYGITNFIDAEEFALVGEGATVASAMGLTSVAALSYLIFNLFTPPCFAAIGAMNAEMEDKKWLWSAIAFQLGVGYNVAFITYQVGTFVTTGALGVGFVPGLIAVAVMVGFVTYLVKKRDRIAEQKLALNRG